MDSRSLICLQDAKLQVDRRSQGQIVSKSKVVKVCRSPKCDGWDILQAAVLAKRAALITGHNEILGKSGAVWSRFPELRQIWHHYCTMMTNSASGFYKEPSRPVFFA